MLELIDKQDGFEIIRDKIAAVLVAEIASQQALALAAAEDPDYWKLRLYTERANIWEQFLNSPSDVSPVINVAFDSAIFVERNSNAIERQKSDSTFNIDCYAYAKSTSTESGHDSGDYLARLELHKAIRFIRNILMAGEYTYLGLSRGDDQIVWRRWIQNVVIYQPEYNGQALQQIAAGRIVFRVEHNEFSPQIAAETLESIFATITRTDDGFVYFTGEFDYGS